MVCQLVLSYEKCLLRFFYGSWGGEGVKEAKEAPPAMVESEALSLRIPLLAIGESTVNALSVFKIRHSFTLPPVIT